MKFGYGMVPFTLEVKHESGSGVGYLAPELGKYLN